MGWAEPWTPWWCDMAEGPEKDEKTEEATARRLEEAREKGQVAFSTELMSATTLVAGLITFALAGPGLAEAAGSSLEVPGWGCELQLQRLRAAGCSLQA